jgi:DNA-binding MarR family transcriptional regulator
MLMRLEEAIQQKRAFRNEHHKVMVNLLYSNNWLEEKSRDFLKQQNISLQQYNILRILRGSGKPLSTMQIRERMLDRMSDTSRIIDRMVVKAIVEKKPNNNDKRLVDITITAKGLQILEELDKQNHELEAIVSALSPDEAKMLNDLLDKMRSD